MNNRLGDLPAWATEDSDDSDNDVPKPNKNGGGDIEMQSQQRQKDNHNQYMENFFREVDSIKADIDAVAQASKDIAKINEQSMRATTTAEEEKLSKMLKPLIETTNKRAKRTKNLLGLLKEETQKLKADGTLNSSDTRYVIVWLSFDFDSCLESLRFLCCTCVVLATNFLDLSHHHHNNNKIEFEKT
jgi:hypothetical protein